MSGRPNVQKQHGLYHFAATRYCGHRQLFSGFQSANRADCFAFAGGFYLLCPREYDTKYDSTNQGHKGLQILSTPKKGLFATEGQEFTEGISMPSLLSVAFFGRVEFCALCVEINLIRQCRVRAVSRPLCKAAAGFRRTRRRWRRAGRRQRPEPAAGTAFPPYPAPPRGQSGPALP